MRYRNHNTTTNNNNNDKQFLSPYLEMFMDAFSALSDVHQMDISQNLETCYEDSELCSCSTKNSDRADYEIRQGIDHEKDYTDDECSVLLQERTLAYAIGRDGCEILPTRIQSLDRVKSSSSSVVRRPLAFAIGLRPLEDADGRPVIVVPKSRHQGWVNKQRSFERNDCAYHHLRRSSTRDTAHAIPCVQSDLTN